MATMNMELHGHTLHPWTGALVNWAAYPEYIRHAHPTDAASPEHVHEGDHLVMRRPLPAHQEDK